VRHDSFIRDTQRIHTCVLGMPIWAIASVTWLIHMCDMTQSYVWHDSFTCVTWLIHICDMTHHMCDMTHSHVCQDWCNLRRDSFIYVTWLIYMCDMAHSYVCYQQLILLTHSTVMTKTSENSFYKRVTLHIHMFDMTPFYCDDKHVGELVLHVSDMTHSYWWHDSFVPWW